MVILLPRLPGPAAEDLIECFLGGPSNWTGFDPADLPEAVRFAATGGSRAGRKELLALRGAVEEAARANGFGADGNSATYARFDAELGASFAEMPLLASGEALRDDFWTFIGVTMAPDVVHWRFRAARERYLGGVRNTFQRLWLRARALDRGEQHPERWQLLEELTEDALVQITERPSVGADPLLAGAVAKGWLRAAKHHGRGKMEAIMRRAVLRVRIWNEIRSLADLPAEALERVLDRAFEVPAEDRREDESAVVGDATEVRESQTAAGPGLSEPRQQLAGISSGPQEDAIGSRVRAARRVLEGATKRRWISPKSMAALVAVGGEPCDLSRSQRNALAHLLARMHTVAPLQEDVALLARAITSQPGGRVR